MRSAKDRFLKLRAARIIATRQHVIDMAWITFIFLKNPGK